MIAVCELAERFSYYGTTVVFVSSFFASRLVGCPGILETAVLLGWTEVQW